MRKVCLVAVALICGVGAATAQNWDKKTIEKMLADGNKKLASANPDERATGVEWISGYITCDYRKQYQPVLVKALKDTNPKVRNTAVSALEKIQAADAIPDIVPLLMDPDSDVAERAAYTLGGLGAAGKPAIPDLQKAQAAYKAKHKSMLEMTMQEGIDEINGKSDGKRFRCPAGK
jgi:HEAT repeat protein